MGLPHPGRPCYALGALDEIPDDQLKGSFLKPNQSADFPKWFGAKALRFTERGDVRRLLEEASANGFTLMLQEFIPGPPTRHVFVEGFVDRRGRICGLLARRRIRMHPEEFGNSTLSVTVPLAEVAGAVETMRGLLSESGTAVSSARSSSSTSATVSSRSWR